MINANINNLDVTATYGKYIAGFMDSYEIYDGEVFPREASFGYVEVGDGGCAMCTFFAIADHSYLNVDDVFQVHYFGEEDKEELYELLLKVPSEGWRVKVIGRLRLEGEPLQPVVDAEFVIVYDKDGNILGEFNYYKKDGLWMEFDFNN